MSILLPRGTNHHKSKGNLHPRGVCLSFIDILERKSEVKSNVDVNSIMQSAYLHSLVVVRTFATIKLRLREEYALIYT